MAGGCIGVRAHPSRPVWHIFECGLARGIVDHGYAFAFVISDTRFAKSSRAWTMNLRSLLGVLRTRKACNLG